MANHSRLTLIGTTHNDVYYYFPAVIEQSEQIGQMNVALSNTLFNMFKSYQLIIHFYNRFSM